MKKCIHCEFGHEWPGNIVNGLCVPCQLIEAGWADVEARGWAVFREPANA